MSLPATLHLLDQAVSAAGYTSCHTLQLHSVPFSTHLAEFVSFWASNSGNGWAQKEQKAAAEFNSDSKAKKVNIVRSQLFVCSVQLVWALLPHQLSDSQHI